MTSKHLVDPQLRAHLESLIPIDLSPGKLTAFRALFTENQLTVPVPPGLSLEERTVPGPPGAPAVLLRICRPLTPSNSRAAILHVHGGGYLAGSARNADEQNLNWARELDCIVVSVEYRLSPETTAPGPVEDAYAALKWLYTEAVSLQIERRLIAVAGESAGGGLAAALALLARDRGEFPLCYQMLTYPMLDDRTTAKRHPYCGEFVWTAELNAIAWREYLGHDPNLEEVSHYAAPARAKSLVGLPPTFIALGSLDLFFEENLEYARRLGEAGVQVELHVYPGAYHGFSNLKHADLFKRWTADRLMGFRQAFTAGPRSYP